MHADFLSKEQQNDAARKESIHQGQNRVKQIAAKKNYNTTVAYRLLLAAEAAERSGTMDSKEAAKIKRRAERIRDCSTLMQGYICTHDRGFHLRRVNLCRDRLCPICNYIRASQRFAALCRAINTMEERKIFRDLDCVLITLTIRNVQVGDLRATMQDMANAWRKMQRNSRLRKYLVGWARGVEVTYNSHRNDYHPHLHILAFVAKGSKENVGTLAKAWQHALGTDYTPVCDVRQAYTRTAEVKGGEDGDDPWAVALAAAREAAKYALKPDDLTVVPRDQLLAFAASVRGLRLNAYGGILADILAELKLDPEAEPPDETETDSHVCPECGSKMVEAVAAWSFRQRVYRIVSTDGGCSAAIPAAPNPYAEIEGVRI